MIQTALFALLTCLQQGEDFHAGAAEVDITPPVVQRIDGYFRERVSTGVKDPLKAKALVFRQGSVETALVICDVIGVPLQVSRKAREEASRRTGMAVPNIIVGATHNHTGPLYYGPRHWMFREQAIAKHGKDPISDFDYGAFLAEKVVEAVVAARAASAPVGLEFGSAVQEPTVSFNRRFLMKDGTVRFNPGQQNPDIVRTVGVIDPEIGILLAREGAGGRVRAALTLFAMHLDTVGGTEFSADYPFPLGRELRKELGEGLVPVFGLGTCGDLNHIDVRVKGTPGPEEIGPKLAKSVLSQVATLKPIEKPSLAMRSGTIQGEIREFTAEETAQAHRDIPKLGGQEMAFLDQVRVTSILAVERMRKESATWPLEVQAIRVGPDLAIVTLPGEIFVDLGLEIKKGSPFAKTFVLEVANDNCAYIPTQKAFREGGYETVNTRLKPGTGERLVEQALKLLHELKKAK